jgi:hypothetical protein
VRGIDEQVAKPELAVAGTVPVRRNRSTRADESVYRESGARARAPAATEG